MSVNLFGISVTETTAADPLAIGAAYEVDGRIVRPPIELARNIVDKVANGVAASHLDEVNRRQLKILGIDVERGDDGKWRSVATVTFRTAFKPAR